MPKLEISDIVSMMKSTNRYEKIGIVLKSTHQLEDFLLTLSESFDFDDANIKVLESIVTGEPVDLEYDFLKQINSIKEKRDGFTSLLFCLKHFGFEKAEESMQMIFDTKYEPYRHIVEKLYSFRVSTDGKSPKLKKVKVAKEVVQHGELLSQRLYAPVEIARVDYPQALGMYSPGVKKEKTLMKVLGHGLTELHYSGGVTELNKWPGVPMGLFSGLVRKLRHEHTDVEIKKEGALRIVNIYH